MTVQAVERGLHRFQVFLNFLGAAAVAVGFRLFQEARQLFFFFLSIGNVLLDILNLAVWELSLAAHRLNLGHRGGFGLGRFSRRQGVGST